MPRRENYKDPDDLFADTRMSFGEHIDNLRTHLVRALVGFAIAMVLSFGITKPFARVFIIQPVERQLGEYYYRLRDKRIAEVEKEVEADPDHPANKRTRVTIEFPQKQLQALAKGEPIEPVNDVDELPDDAYVKMKVLIHPFEVARTLTPGQRLLELPPAIKRFSIVETFMVYFKVSMLLGLVLGSPWILYQFWMFIAAGLYPHEKRYVHFYLPFSISLFLGGAAAFQFLVLPKAISGLLWFNE